MANIESDFSVSPRLSQKEGSDLLGGILDHSWDGSDPLKVSHDASIQEGPDVSLKSPPPAPTDAKSTSNTSRPSLVQLGSNGSSTSHPKRFSAVNINKKFLEKNSYTVGPPPTSQSSANAKSGGQVLARPQIQPPSSHSRLVTTKLTSISPASSTSGAGWSRPSSVAPPNNTGSPPNGGSPLLPAASTTTTTVAPGTTPHTKVIQPQPRAALPQQRSSPKIVSGGASTKPVWRNLKSLQTTPQLLEVRQNDFPTAAEVAQGTTSLRIVKASENAEAAIIAAANKQARIEEADTFRGVHLDPNAHHWDEMEEDDDNFLGGVIEFGDGRQYKVEPSSRPSESPPLSDSLLPLHSNHVATSRLDEDELSKHPSSEVPVSKEERFADDFDRSWPRSRTSPALSARDFSLSSGPLPTSARAGPTVPISPVVSHSPQETSRVLFNERSNRLEPYSHTHRTGPHPSKRGSHHESPTSPTELKSPQDFSPVSPLHNNIQLLQKHGNIDSSTRSRRFSGSSSGAISSGYSGSYQRDRDQLLRDEPPHSARTSKINTDPSGQDKDGGERGRRSAMGPPALPSHALRRVSKEGGRQLPPHLLGASPSTPVPQGHLSSRDSKFPPGGSVAPRPPSRSSVHSHTSLVSPGLASSSLPQLSAPELDEVRKDVMQSAAARAKQRRQQEEEEREKEKERARRKAAEIEQRMKVAEAEKAKLHEVGKPAELEDDAVVAIIEEAVKGVGLPEDTLLQSQAGARPSVSRTPPLKAGPIQVSDVSHSPTSQGISTSAPSIVSLPVSATTTRIVQAESWRSKATPSNSPLEVSSKASASVFLSPPPSALEQIESLVSNPEEELEVVDFSDMGKFVGATDVSPSPVASSQQVLGTVSFRPVASDFFDDTQEAPNPTNTNIVAWRQKLSQEMLPGPDEDASIHLDRDKQSNPTSDPLPTSEATKSVVDYHVQAVSFQRTPRAQTFYKEAAMSALDDVMSRIKGALDGMQAGETTKEVPLLSPESDSSTIKSSVPRSLGRLSSQKDRWIPSPLRVQNYDCEPQEAPVTGFEPPRSPKPAWNAFVIRLPKSAGALEPISRKQLHFFSKPAYPVRWDILSFDPPVEGMNRRDFALNDVLFGKPSRGYKGNPKYRVILPRLGPRVNIPSHPPSQKTNGAGAFGRPGGADGVATWRKPAPTIPQSGNTITSEPGLSTISRSPPPDTLSMDHDVASVPISNSSDSVKADGITTAMRSRLQPKMPAGSAVAFYRDSRIDAVEADLKPSVNFIVNSELEEPRHTTPVKVKPSITVTSPLIISPSIDSDSVRNVKSLLNGINSPPSTERASPSLVPGKAESKCAEDPTDRVPITPPSPHNSPWTRTSLSMPLKESPARGPDPEHLKAVWSQTSNKSGLHSVNSLEGIADDLTALPFTLQEVKSEDGETPPPSVPAAPSRMSLHEVTKAFQQVPSSSSSSTSHRTPPITAPPTARPPNYAYTLPPPPLNTIRPSYGAYPSPMLSHSPSPGVMYPHPMASSPVPNRMPVNGHNPVYNQPMWMSMAGPSPQSHGNMMRPITSPYPAQLMPYPSPGTPAMYASQSPASMQNNSQQQTDGQANRDRSMSLMSPVMPHAAPTMYGSPVLMHAPVMPVPQSHGYMPIQNGRGQVRADSGHMPMQQHPQQSNYLLPQSSYNSVTSPSFVRSPW